MAVMQRIRKDTMKTSEFKYIDDFEKFQIQLKVHDDVVREEGREQGREDKTQELIIKAYLKGFSSNIIADLTNLSIQKIEDIIEKYITQMRKNN